MKKISAKDYQANILKKTNSISSKKIPSKIQSKEKNYFKVITKEQDYVKIIFYGHTDGMNTFISSSYEKYMIYKRKIHNLASLLKNHFINFDPFDLAIVNIIPFRANNRRILDKDNLIAGIKPLIDALHEDLNLFKDDTEEFSHINYYPQQIDKENPRIEIEIYNPQTCKNENLFIFLKNLNKYIYIDNLSCLFENNNKYFVYYFKDVYEINKEDFHKVLFKFNKIKDENYTYYFNFNKIKYIKSNKIQSILKDISNNEIILNININNFIGNNKTLFFKLKNDNYINRIYINELSDLIE